MSAKRKAYKVCMDSRSKVSVSWNQWVSTSAFQPWEAFQAM